MGCPELPKREEDTHQEPEDVMAPRGMRIPVAEPDIGEEELKLVSEAVRSGWVSSKGRFIEEFERGFADFVGMKYGVATSNGTVAIHLALVALGIGPGDEVIMPDLTFASVGNAIIYTGARPVFVDVHQSYWGMDPERVKEAITERTKAIIVVHLYGHPCDLDPLLEVAEDHGLYVIEDCAEAHGAEYKGRRVGSFGDIACFSFYGNKIITTGEGGMCLTNDYELAERMRMLRDHGMRPEKRYWHEVVGFNYRMTNLQAALGVAQLRRIDEFIRKKIEIARAYEAALDGIEGITLHPEMPWAKCVYWLYSILVDEKAYGLSRDELKRRLAEEGVETRRFFYPMHVMPPYRPYLRQKQKFPVAERLASMGLNLPSGVKLSKDAVAYIADLIYRLHHEAKSGGGYG